MPTDRAALRPPPRSLRALAILTPAPAASLGGTRLYDEVDRLEVFGIGTNKEMFHIW